MLRCFEALRVRLHREQVCERIVLRWRSRLWHKKRQMRAGFGLLLAEKQPFCRGSRPATRFTGRVLGCELLEGLYDRLEVVFLARIHEAKATDLFCSEELVCSSTGLQRGDGSDGLDKLAVVCLQRFGSRDG